MNIEELEALCKEMRIDIGYDGVRFEDALGTDEHIEIRVDKYGDVTLGDVISKFALGKEDIPKLIVSLITLYTRQQKEN